MARTKVKDGTLTEANYKTKKDGYEKECYVTEISFDHLTTEMLFSDKPEKITKTDWSVVEFAGALVIFNSEKPTYLYKSEKKANAFRKTAIPGLGMNGRLSSIKDDADVWMTLYSIQFEPMPSESKIKSWKYTISRNEEAYDLWKRRKAGEARDEAASSVENDEVF